MSDLYNVADSIYILAYRGWLEFSEFYTVSNLWLDYIINRTDKDITLCLLSFQNINQIHKVIQTSKSFSCNSRIFLGLQPKSIFYLQLPFFCSCFQSRKQLYIHKCPFVHLFVCPSFSHRNPSTAWNQHPSTFIILHSSFLHFATYKLFSLLLNH